MPHRWPNGSTNHALRLPYPSYTPRSSGSAPALTAAARVASTSGTGSMRLTAAPGPVGATAPYEGASSAR